MESGRIWGRGIEWDAVRSLLARETRTVMGRERALEASPFTDLVAIHAELALTREARDALTTAGAPPLENVPDVRSALDRSRADGAVLDGGELWVLIPLLAAGPRLTAFGRRIRPVAPALSDITDRFPRLDDLYDTLCRALADDGGLTDDASPKAPSTPTTISCSSSVKSRRKCCASSPISRAPCGRASTILRCSSS